MRPRLPALEKNILKYRALQMILLLHEVESFRAFLIPTIRTTHADRLPLQTKRPLEKAIAILVSDGILTTAEAEDLEGIINLRNTIGHAIHELVVDVSEPSLSVLRKSAFDYAALIRFERYRRKISEGMAGHYILTTGLREVVFEQAEATYREELRRLRRRIEKQVRRREHTA